MAIITELIKRTVEIYPRAVGRHARPSLIKEAARIFAYVMGELYAKDANLTILFLSRMAERAKKTWWMRDKEKKPCEKQEKQEIWKE